MKKFNIVGRVINRETKQGIGGLKVEAWDKDLILKDLLGAALTDEQGSFQIDFSESSFRNLIFVERKPDIFFKLFLADKLIESTENSVLWNVGAAKKEIVIETLIDRLSSNTIDPDRRKLTSLQIKRLSAITDISVETFKGLSVAEISTKFKWRIDPELLFFHKICGKVVKKDPVTGVEYPVPFATVNIEDTDCNLLAYFPIGWQWTWFYPLFCHREVLATVKTDKCGNFCAYVPWFDIDWILRWRKQRVCFPSIFVRPTIADLIDIPELHPIPKPKFPRIPIPDPAPFVNIDQLHLNTIEAIGGTVARDIVQQVINAQSAQTLGARTLDVESFANTRAFERELQPPLSSSFQDVLTGSANLVADKDAQPHEAVRSAIAAELGVHHSALEQLDLKRFIGPFFRCFDIFLPQWQLILDVPDITFRVTQDTNGDGIEETIYSEGYFDVRWDAGAIPAVTLVASASAKESHLCETPTVPCTNTPELLFAGLMPLTDPIYFDAVNGYATRPNRPAPPLGHVPPAPPALRPVAKTPFFGTLQLYGCVNVPNAKYYRVLASTDNGATFNAITGFSWNIYPIPFGIPHLVSADINGWYPVIPNPADFHPAHLVLEWSTPSLGKIVLKIEVADVGKVVLPLLSNIVAIQVDNTAPTVTFDTLAWKFASEPDSAFNLSGRNLLVPCPTIRRGVTAQDIEIIAKVSASAHHLRDAYLYSFGCGGGLFSLISSFDDSAHWHQSVTDNSITLNGRYSLLSSALEGAYGVGCRANSRAMNPSGADGGHLSPPDWLYDTPYLIYAQPEIRVAIVNA